MGLKVGFFDVGYGLGYLVWVIGYKWVKEVWFLNYFYMVDEVY